MIYRGRGPTSGRRDLRWPHRPEPVFVRPRRYTQWSNHLGLFVRPHPPRASSHSQFLDHPAEFPRSLSLQNPSRHPGRRQPSYPPVLVTVEPARTAKLPADPSWTGAWTAAASWRGNMTATAKTRPTKIRFVPFTPTRGLHAFIIIIFSSW